jgi:ketosteroid isomerase-like protein
MARQARFSRLALFLATGLALSIISASAVNGANAPAADDRKAVAALDTEYQAAVKANDSATMDKILADDFVLVTASGKTYTKADMLKDAQSGTSKYDKNDESVQTVRVWGDTAVVTAKLWEKGTEDGKPFEHLFWFSDTYVRTSTGWKYVFGQSAYCPCQKTP